MSFHRFVLFAVRCLLCLALSGTAWAARGATPLTLEGGSSSVDAWASLRVLADPTRELTLDGARQRLDEFTPPAVPYANFGARADALWLHLPIVRHGGPDRWVLEIDYPSLQRIDAYVVTRNQAPRHVVLGNLLHAEQRPMRTRAHALTLDLPAGERTEVFLRVQTASTMILPVTLFPQERFVAHESARQLLQGLMFGIAVALLAYAVANGLSLRDALYFQYALMVIGVTVFLASFTGIGHQHLWPQQTGLLAKIAPLGALLATIGGALFAANALQTRRSHPRITRGMHAVAWAAGAVIVASVLGIVDYRFTQLSATVLAPVPVVLALRVALVQARGGDPVAILMVIGWGAYTLGAVNTALLLRGLIPADFWGQHLFQFCSMLEMFAWVRVLGLHIEGVRREAERAAAEKDALHSLAHTDAVTGLPNRRGLNAALESALTAARPDRALAVYLLDLDDFKPVNDRLGHDAGDELLVQVAQRLRGLLRHADVVARLGGDEFVVMSGDLASDADAQRLGQKMLDAFREPFTVAGQDCRVGLTIGFALAPHDGNTAADLLKRADAAMYVGKQAGRHCIRRGAASPGLATG